VLSGGKGLRPFPRTPIFALTTPPPLRSGQHLRRQKTLDEAEHFHHNRKASVASLRSAFDFIPESRSPSLRNGVHLRRNTQPHGGIPRRCSRCRRPAPGYDRLAQRRWLFAPLWGIPTWFCYAPRRVECAEHGVVVEHIPWSDGKRPVTCAMMGFLPPQQNLWVDSGSGSRPKLLIKGNFHGVVGAKAEGSSGNHSGRPRHSGA
jgi:hypothetical protein